MQEMHTFKTFSPKKTQPEGLLQRLVRAYWLKVPLF